MYKIDKIGGSILIDKRYFYLGKKIQIWMSNVSIRILKGLINFIEDLIASKISFFGVNWKKLKFRD
jgi:hypothetical protein